MSTEVSTGTENVNPEEGQLATPATEVEGSPTNEAFSNSVEDAPIIPKKFVGKSIEDVIKAYSESESELGRLRNEAGELKKKVRTYETTVPNNTVNQAATPIASAPVKTIDEMYDEEFEVNPKYAIAKRMERLRQADHQALMSQNQTSFYTQAKSGSLKGYEDFAELEPLMAQIVPSIADMIKPEFLSDARTLQALHLIARGATLTEKLNQAEKSGARRASAINKEKESAFSESSSGSSTSDAADPWQIPLSDFKKLYGTARR